MDNQKELIYNFNEHGLYYDNWNIESLYKVYIFTIDTLQLAVDYHTGELLSIYGFLPLVKAKKKAIDIPSYLCGKFYVSTDNLKWQSGIAYDYCDCFSPSYRYFILDGLPRVEYDEDTKRILIGSQNINDKSIKINKNIICGIDKNDNLKYLLLSIDKIIK